jgi:lipopolysaccharide transport system ATP-binding protein
MKPMIEIRSISKAYSIYQNRPQYRTLRDSLVSWFKPNRGRREFLALDDISYDILPGEKVGIIGENGAGKTTLLKTLSRITSPTKGSIVMRGRVASLLEVGTGFHPELTGRENIFLNGSILGLSMGEIKGKFDAIVAFSEIETFLDTPVKHYSTGMWARLAFSVAAHLDPEVLLIDEVLSVGDADFQKRSLGKMSEISRQGRTILFVSHNLPAVKQLCTKCMWIKKGKLQMVGKPDEVIDAYRSCRQTDDEGSADFTSSTQRRGNQDIRLVRIELKNQHGITTGAYAIGDDLHIHLYTEPRTALRKVKIVVTLHEANGDCLCTMYDNDSGFSLQNVDPSHPAHISLRLADLRFCPGRYLITVELVSEMFNYQYDAYDVLDSCIGFSVVNNSVVNRELYRYGGLLYLTPDWKEHERGS